VSHGLAFRLRRRSRAALRRNARPYAFAGVVALRSSLTLPRFPVLLRRSASTVVAISVRPRPQAQVPVNGMIPHWSGSSTRERVIPRRPGCPLGWRCERGGGFLNGESEDSGRLELWLFLARRASNSRMRSRRCAMSTVCSATRSRNRLSSSSGFFQRMGWGWLFQHRNRLRV